MRRSTSSTRYAGEIVTGDMRGLAQAFEASPARPSARPGHLQYAIMCSPFHSPLFIASCSTCSTPVLLVVQGSATGAYSAFSSGVVPSFVLMAIKGSKVVTYVYELRDGEVNVSKSEFIKQKHK